MTRSRYFLGLTVAFSVLLSGCIDMSIPRRTNAKLDCPGGYYALPTDVTCSETDDCVPVEGGWCKIFPKIDPSGGDGLNCPAGYITTHSTDMRCDSDTGDDTGRSCTSGFVQERCLEVPPESPDPTSLPVLSGQRCSAEQLDAPSDSLRVHIIDVGQGDAIWIRTPTGQNVLIDGGDMSAYGRTDGGIIVNDFLYINGFGSNEEFDAIILSHPDSDHYGGLPRILNKHKTKYYLDPGIPSGTAYNNWLANVRNTNAKILMPLEDHIKPKDNFPTEIFGNDVKATYLYSNKNAQDADNSTASNVGSIVFKLEYEGKTFLFTGDVTKQGESKILADNGNELKINYFKSCHHGSASTSNTQNFINGIFENVSKDERFSMISSGRRTFSGSTLPSEQTLDYLKSAMDISHIYSTAAGDANKEEEDASRDDNILIVVKNNGTSYICYSGTN